MRTKESQKVEEILSKVKTNLSTELFLDGNNISSLPDDIFHLGRLQVLFLNNNQIETLPDALGELKYLRILAISGNRLSSLPDVFGHLNNLEEIYLGKNQLLTLPNSFYYLKRLRVLHVSENKLTELPDFIGQLKSIEKLYLHKNQIQKLPDSLCNLSRLRQLTVFDNQLRDIPPMLPSLFNQIHEFSLKGNPISPELQFAYYQGTSSLLKFLKARRGGEISLNEVKLIFVGDGAVGKTSLLNALQGGEWVENRKQTIGVEVNVESFALDNINRKSIVTFNCWDFGGQNHYRNTHQLFFTAPAIYLAVWKPRNGINQSCVEEWIEMVKNRTYDKLKPHECPKILIVATHGGPNEPTAHIDKDYLNETYGNFIFGFYHVDSKTGFGIEALKKAIVEAANDIGGSSRMIPQNWLNLKNSLYKLSAKTPYITYKKYQNICRRHKISSDLAKMYATIFNELGHLVYYNDDSALEAYMILRAEWLSKAISRLLDNKTIQDQNGLVQDSQLFKLWDDPSQRESERYPAELHHIFVKLMERYDFSYRVSLQERDAPATLLLAELVPSKRPDGWEDDWPSELTSDNLQRTQVCRIVDSETGRSVAVEGLIYRLIVRLHRFSLGRQDYYKSRHWQIGMILDYGYNGRALIENKAGDIHVTVRAAYPERFLSLLCEEIEWLIKYFWKGLRCVQSVPCPPPCKGLLELEELIQYKMKGYPEIRCSVCRKWFDIDSQMISVGTKPTIHEALEKIEKGVSNLSEGVSEHLEKSERRVMSYASQQYDNLLSLLTDDAKDGPRLFSIKPTKTGFYDKPGWVSQKFLITLWCEHSMLPIPILDNNPESGVYKIELNNNWFKEYAPFIKAMSFTLRLILPIAIKESDIIVPNDISAEFHNQLEFGKTCGDVFSKNSKDVSEWLTTDDGVSDWLIGDDGMHIVKHNPISARGSALRELHNIIKTKDPNQYFGGLVRVLNKRREFRWVHPKFRDGYPN